MLGFVYIHNHVFNYLTCQHSIWLHMTWWWDGEHVQQRSWLRGRDGRYREGERERESEGVRARGWERERERCAQKRDTSIKLTFTYPLLECDLKHLESETLTYLQHSIRTPLTTSTVGQSIQTQSLPLLKLLTVTGYPRDPAACSCPNRLSPRMYACQEMLMRARMTLKILMMMSSGEYNIDLPQTTLWWV